MSPWHSALRTYRRRALEEAARDSGDVMFILCSEDHAAAALVAACEPRLVLQTLGGARDPSEPATRATLEYAVRRGGVRRIVLCGHTGCQAAPHHHGVDARAAAQAELVAQWRRLRQDAAIGGLLLKHRVSVRAVCFDDREGDVYACDPEGRPATLMGDEDFGRLLARAS